MHKVTLLVAEIKKLLRPLAGVINSSSVLPILDDIFIEVDGKNFKMTVTDLETSITVNMTIAPVFKSFNFCVDFKLFKSLIDRCDTDNLLLEYQPDKKRVVIKSHQPEFTLSLPTEDVDNYPKIATIPAPDYDISIASADLLPYLRIANTFTSNDDLRPSMTGVCFYTTKEFKLMIVATDAHRLYKKEIVSTSKPLPGKQYIIPGKSSKILCTLFKGGFTMRGSETHTECFDADYRIIFRNIDAGFPDWEVVWPKEVPYSFYAKRKQFKAMLVLAQPYANKSTNQINFKLTKDSIEAISQDIDFSIEFSYKLPVYETVMATDNFEFALSNRFVFPAVQLSKDENVRIRYNKATLAFILDDDILIMPLMRNS